MFLQGPGTMRIEKNSLIGAMIIYGCLLCCGIVALFPGKSAEAYEWEPTTLRNENLDTPYSKIKADPTDPDVIWVATGHLPFPNPLADLPPANGIYKSTDRGDTWVQMNDDCLTPDINISDIDIHPVDTDIVYLATNQKGYFKTTNGGQDWFTINSGIEHKGMEFPEESWCATDVMIHPEDTEEIFGCVSNLNNIDILSGTGDHPGFFKSTDGGASWAEKNQGFPLRYDPLTPFDLVSHTVCPMSIQFFPPDPNIIVVGMGDAEINAVVFFFRKAITSGRIFYNLNRGEYEWQELSSGLPTIITSADSELTFARGSVSIITFAQNIDSTAPIVVSHFGAGSEIYDIPFDTDTWAKSRGLYRFGSWWDEINIGLPVLEDENNRNSINTFSPVFSPVKQNILLVGIFDADMGDTLSDRSQVWASVNKGNRWMNGWSSGLSVSEHGYTEASPFFLEINKDQSAVFAAVRWDFNPDSPWNPGTIDDGVYRMFP